MYEVLHLEKEVQAGRCTEGRARKKKQGFSKTDPYGTWNPHTVWLRHRFRSQNCCGRAGCSIQWLGQDSPYPEPQG